MVETRFGLDVRNAFAAAGNESPVGSMRTTKRPIKAGREPQQTFIPGGDRMPQRAFRKQHRS